MPLTRKLSAFSLVELLTVIAIIAILASLIIAAVSRVRNRANGAREISNLRQIGVALQQYVGDNDGAYPFLNVASDKISDPKASPTDFWNLQLAKYVPHRVTMEDQNSVFQSPLVKKENRHPISDYGANMAVFRDANPGNPGRSTGALRSVALNSLIGTVSVLSAWYRPAGDRPGNWVASWYIETPTYVANGSAGSMPQPRIGAPVNASLTSDQLVGGISALFCDGHVETIDWKKFHSNRAKYLEVP